MSDSSSLLKPGGSKSANSVSVSSRKPIVSQIQTTQHDIKIIKFVAVYIYQ